MDASQVQYVARAGNFRSHGFEYHGALRILKVIMEYDYLWINVRVKGGAYGCMNGYMRNGDTYFVSYRDPNLEKTNEIYDQIPAYIDRSMAAYLQGITIEQLQRERDQVLDATVEDIRGLKDMIASVLAEDNLCVIGNEDRVKEQEAIFMEVKHLNH